MEGYQMFTIFIPKKSKIVEKKPAAAKKVEGAEVEIRTAKPAAEKKVTKKVAEKKPAVAKDDDEIF
jgi:hypothetical protein